MLALTIIILVMTSLVGLLFFALFHWAVKNGQFDDVEEAKYQMFREDEDDLPDAVEEEKHDGKE